MIFQRFTKNPFYFPEEAVDNKIPATSDKDDVIKFLGDDDDEPEDIIDLDDKKKEKKEDKKDIKDKNEEDDDKDDKDDEDKDDDKDDDDEEDDELKELEEELDELEDPDDDKLELTTPVSRREILKKYPKVFEDFPYLEKAYYREQQYTKHFANPSDAEAAVGQVEMLGKIENDLVAGDLTNLLKVIKATSPKSFSKMVNNYLPKLYETDEKAYNHVMGNFTKTLIYNMATKGKKNNDEELMQAAETLNKFIFNSDEFTPPKEFGEDIKDDDKAADAVKQKEQETLEASFKGAVEEVTDKVRNLFKATIKGNIDPKSQMTDFVKDAATEKALSRLEGILNRDHRFKALVDRLWEQAVKENFSKDSKDKIKKAFRLKASSLLPSVLKEARTTALKGSNKSKKAKDEDDIDDDDKNDSEGKRPKEKSNSQSKSTKKGQVPAGMSSLDYLMSDD